MDKCGEAVCVCVSVHFSYSLILVAEPRFADNEGNFILRPVDRRELGFHMAQRVKIETKNVYQENG